MKRFAKICTFLIVLVMVFGLCTTAYAAGSVTYDGDANKFIFAPGTKDSPSSLFENFQNVMPGDTLTEQIEIRNTSQNGSYIRLYLRALGAQEGTDEFLSQMNLTVKHNGANTLFEAPVNETAQLTDWVYLGAMHSGGTATLDVTLEVPITMGNDFQHQIGYFDWEFMAEEIPAEENPPQTGDTAEIFLYSGLIILCLAAIILLLLAGKKKKNKAQ